MATEKNPTSFRLSDTAHALLDGIVASTGESQTSVVERAIRALAKREGVTAGKKPEKKSRKAD